MPVIPLEPALIFGQEPVEMMEQHPVEDGPLRMPRPTTLGRNPDLLDKTTRVRTIGPKSEGQNVNRR
jgi:hypothetical protein